MSVESVGPAAEAPEREPRDSNQDGGPPQNEDEDPYLLNLPEVDEQAELDWEARQASKRKPLRCDCIKKIEGLERKMKKLMDKKVEKINFEIRRDMAIVDFDALCKNRELVRNKKNKFSVASWNCSGAKSHKGGRTIVKAAWLKSIMSPDVMMLQESKNATGLKGYQTFHSR